MQIPVEISFRNIEASAAAENDIRGHVERLERVYGRMTTCRVRVDQRNQNQNGTIPPVVHIEISLPGHKDIVVAHEPEHLRHEAASEFRGQVAELTPGEDFGFLMNKEGGLLYFHRNSLLSGDFDRLHRGDEVSYVEEMGDNGPQASKVRVLEDH